MWLRNVQPLTQMTPKQNTAYIHCSFECANRKSFEVCDISLPQECEDDAALAKDIKAAIDFRIKSAGKEHKYKCGAIRMDFWDEPTGADVRVTRDGWAALKKEKIFKTDVPKFHVTFALKKP